MKKRRGPLDQLIAYQGQLDLSGQEHQVNPAEQWRARLHQESGLRAKIMAITFDFWYPLVDGFGPQMAAFSSRTKTNSEAADRVGPKNFTRQNFVHLELAGANLTGAKLAGFDLIGLDLSGANLGEAVLVEADLSWADLSDADLQRANLERAYLFETKLHGAKLLEANLGQVDLRGAEFSDTTLWPTGFDPVRAGAVKTG